MLHLNQTSETSLWGQFEKHPDTLVNQALDVITCITPAKFPHYKSLKIPETIKKIVSVSFNPISSKKQQIEKVFKTNSQDEYAYTNILKKPLDYIFLKKSLIVKLVINWNTCFDQIHF